VLRRRRGARRRGRCRGNAERNGVARRRERDDVQGRGRGVGIRVYLHRGCRDGDTCTCMGNDDVERRMRSLSGVNAELAARDFIGSKSSSAPPPTFPRQLRHREHCLEGDAAEGRGDKSCLWVGKVTKVSTKGQTVSVMTEADAPTQDMQIQQTPQHLSIVLRTGGACTTSQWAREGGRERAWPWASLRKGKDGKGRRTE
jgi:hypothetical protein